jgi:PAS domain S-box-containing protein
MSSYADAYRLAAIVASSGDAIISKDLNGVVQSWNAAAERMFGYTAEEAIGRSMALIILPERLSEEDAVLDSIRAGKTVQHGETWRRRKDGTLIPIWLTVSPIRDGEGRVIGASTIAHDISDRLRAQEELAEALRRQRDLQDRLVSLVAASKTLFGSPKLDDVIPAIIMLARTMIVADGYAIWRFDARTKRWKIEASWGVSDEFMRRTVSSSQGGHVSSVAFDEPLVARSVDSVPMLAERLEAYRREKIESMLVAPLTISGSGTGTLVFYFRTPHDFSDVEVQTARALSNVAAAAISTAELYDKQRRSREQAERANLQAAFLAEASAALASSLDYEATLRTVANLAVPQIADWCAVDMVDEYGEMRRLGVAHADPAKVQIAQTLRERYPEDPNSAGGVAHVIRTGQPILYEDFTDAMLVAAARDEEHLADLRALQIRSMMIVPLAAHGRASGALTFVQAESGRRYTDADLRFAQDVGYRSALAVENARAYREASAANRAKDEFLATLSHELRTPLNAVLGWTRMLRSGNMRPEKMTRALEVVERNALAQLDLVEDLLDLSRIITGKFRLDVQPVDLPSAIRAAVEAIQPAANAKGITITVDTRTESSPIMGDAARLQQAVWNLLSNAIKFTPNGGRVSVKLRRTESDAQIEVADSGEGIDGAVLPYIFDRFRQGDAGMTRSHQGLGLGLAIVRHIVEMHGGRASVTSAGRGQGATFTMVIPALAEVRSAEAPAGDRGRTAQRSLAGIRALVVDDDGDARDLLAEVLRASGVDVVLAASATEGLAAFERQQPDVLVTDLAMPETDGFELIRRIRALPSDRGGRVPAVAVTAYARAEDSERSLTSGFQAHLTKPIDSERLLSAIADLAGRSNSAA